MHAQKKHKIKGIVTILLIIFGAVGGISYFQQTQAAEQFGHDFLVKKFPNEFPQITNLDLHGLTGWRLRFRLSQGRRGNLVVGTSQKVLGLPIFGGVEDMFVVEWGFVDLNKDY